ncbi:RNA polymerase sigma factor [Lysobacter brunescens]|uniref:RNA polymerase sigma factor n=1 Tax=Lysobacter brunescens TaxID=262323 RepID=A0ABW2Y8D0_9GAMM
MTDARLQRTLDALWRMESPKLVARVARMTGDVGVAEELAQDVLLAALERWPADGVPDNPAAWLMTTAKHRAIDHLRQRALHARRQDEYGIELALHGDAMGDEAQAFADDDIGDDLLRLVFVSCHPVLPRESRVALTLRLLGGLTTAEIARAFLQAEPTVAQRIVRAKRTLAERDVAFEVPRRAELAERLDAVLEVIYLVFNEGYAASAGDDWMRPALCEEALRLARVLAGLMPDESEVLGLLALMELQASRARARTDADGAPVLLLQQDRSRWDRLQIRRGLVALRRAQALGGGREPYALQAAIAACHAIAARAEDTDWSRIAALYAVLCTVMPSPVIELNRAVAVGMAEGPKAALPLVDALCEGGALRDYGLLHAVRADLLQRLGRLPEAGIEYQRAAALAGNVRDRDLMRDKARACAIGDG